jgi:hypothetical protein
MLLRWAAALGVLAVGAVSGGAAVLVHQRWWGLALGLVSATAVAVALPARWWLRPAFAAGWMAVVTAAVLPRAEGDYLIPANVAGYAVLGWSFALLLASLVTLPPRRRAREDPGDPPAPT